MGKRTDPAVRDSRNWQPRRIEAIERAPADITRLFDLSLAMIVPWKDGYPQYIGDMDTPEGWQMILEATKEIRLPWQL